MICMKIVGSETDQKGVDASVSWDKKGISSIMATSGMCLWKVKKVESDPLVYQRHLVMIGAHLPVVLDKVDIQAGSWLYADKFDSGLPNATLVKKYNIQPAIQQQSAQHKLLTDMAKQFHTWVVRDADTK